jgi:hypothetical protein
VPVDILDFLVVGGLDDVEHVLGGVSVWRAWRSTVALKVLEEGLRLRSEI